MSDGHFGALPYAELKVPEAALPQLLQSSPMESDKAKDSTIAQLYVSYPDPNPILPQGGKL